MDFYLNEYSLDGQFSDEEEFIYSLRDITLPVFKEIKSLFKDDCLIYKSSFLWERPVCTSLKLNDILVKSSRIPELRKMKELLHELCNDDPYFSDYCDIENVKYCFKHEKEYSNPNCFILAALNDGDIFSFVDSTYECNDLKLFIKEKEYILHNIYDKKSFEDYKLKYKFGSESPKTRWENTKYRLEIRPKENNCNEPHVHIVVKGEYDISYSLEDLSILEKKPQNASNNELNIHLKLIDDYKGILVDTWNYYHSDRLVKQLVEV